MSGEEWVAVVTGVLLGTLAVAGCGGDTLGSAQHVDTGGGGDQSTDGSGGVGARDSGVAGDGGSVAAGGAASRVDAGVPDPSTPVSCEGNALCPPEWCEFGCCGPGSPGGGCAGCCMPKMCQAFDEAHCPLDRCQLLPGCSGTSICFNTFSGDPPSCGDVGYYGASAPCCSGLEKRCGALLADGSCDPKAGGYMGIPQCLACGNGSCDTPFENRCNCPGDCR